MVDLFEAVLMEPRLPAAALERERDLIQEQIKLRADRPQQIAMREFLGLLFAGHPYALDPLGDQASLQRVNRDSVVGFLDSMKFQKNVTLSLTGDVDVKRWSEMILRIVKKWPIGERLGKKLELNELGSSKRKFISLKKEQSHIFLGYRGLTVTDPRRYALQIANAILAGMGGRLFVELREKASLAYTVAPLQLEGIDTGYFGAYIGCSPEKGAQAIEMMRVELHRLAESPPSQAELDRAQRYISGRHDLDLQRNSSVCESILVNEALGIPAEEVFDYGSRIESVRAVEVQEVMQSILQGHEVLVAGGAQSPWPSAERAAPLAG